MSIKKPIIIASIAAALGLVAIGGAALAQGSNGSSLVDQIASRFHLNKSDVQQVFDQNRQANQANREKNYETRLDTAVKNGQITADQKTLILAKHQEILNFISSIKGKSAADRRQAITQERTDITDWAKQNNIPLNLLGFFGGGMGGMHRGMMGGTQQQ